MNNTLVRVAARLLRAPRLLLVAILGVSASTTHAQLLTATDSQLGSFDQSSDFRFYDLTPFESFAGRTISDVSLSVAFGKFADDDFSPPFYQEITLSLFYLDFETFDFTEVFLIDQFSLALGPDGESFVGTITFSDLAALPVDNNPDALTSGTFRPVQPLSAFSGQTFQTGLWGLYIEDIQEGAPLIYGASELRIELQPLQAVPEPSTYALGGMILLAGVVAFRRIQKSRTAVIVG